MSLAREFRRLFRVFHREQDYFSNFDRIASLPSLASVGIFARLKEALGPRPGKVLDFGCGLGYVADFLGGEGVDVSAHAVAQARRRFPRRRFHVKTIAQMESWKQAFDHVVCVNVIEHLVDADRERFFRLLPRLLRPGGRVAFVYDNMYHPLQLLSAIRHPGTLLLDPTHETCWTVWEFGRLLEKNFHVDFEAGGNIQSMTLPWGNAFHTARLYVCRPRQ